MRNNAVVLTSGLLIKLISILFVLLAITFISGVAIGKNDKKTNDRTSADEEGAQEKLSDCVYRFDEIRAKYIQLSNIAKEKGLIDKEGKYNPNLVCYLPEEEPRVAEVFDKFPKTKVDGGGAETLSEKKSEKSEAAKPAPQVAEKKEKRVEKSEATQKSAKPETDLKELKNKTIEEIIAQTKSPMKSNNCAYSIQIFSAPDKEGAIAASKRYSSIKTRLVEGLVKDKNWYRLRHGCFATRAEAEKVLPEVQKIAETAIIAAE